MIQIAQKQEMMFARNVQIDIIIMETNVFLSTLSVETIVILLELAQLVIHLIRLQIQNVFQHHLEIPTVRLIRMECAQNVMQVFILKMENVKEQMFFVKPITSLMEDVKAATKDIRSVVQIVLFIFKILIVGNLILIKTVLNV